MKRIFIVSLFSLFAICAPSFAEFLPEEVHSGYDVSPEFIHWAITLIGLFVAAQLSIQAFGRALPVAKIPTFPIYMTSRQQYMLGRYTFVLFACGFFLLLVHEHRQVTVLMQPLHIVPNSIIEAINDQTTSYLIIVAAMGATYLYCLTYEKPWNALLLMRNVIHNWISVPQMVKRIIAQIQFALSVPQSGVCDVVAAAKGAVEETDFRKDFSTLDRKWAEIWYINLWLAQKRDAGGDVTFFSEESFAYQVLRKDFEKTSRDVGSRKSGSAAEPELPAALDDLHGKFSRLVACYLIYRNGSRKELYREAIKFGVKLSDTVSENPLRYWIVYMVALMASVWVGVHVSAAVYDLITSTGMDGAQDPTLAVKWIMYSASNYGLAIMVVLLVRLYARSLESEAGHSHLITYCWTGPVAFLVGPAGLTAAIHFFGPADLANKPIHLLFYELLRWGLGPSTVCVYISYYLDRQTYADLPNIDHSSKTVGWRLLNCFAFAAINLFLLLPPLLALHARPGATFSTSKLQFVASGATFCIALGLALAAQFELRKTTGAEANTHDSSGGQGAPTLSGYRA